MQYIDYAVNENGISPITKTNYLNALKACQITEFDAENVDHVWKTLLEKLNAGVSYGAIYMVMSMTKGLMKLHDLVYPKNYDYNVLVSRLRKSGTVPEAYSESHVKEILRMTQGKDNALFRICILCTYSGLRISACENLKFTDFHKIEPHGIYCFIVESKGKKYIAAISQYAYELMWNSNYVKSEYVAQLGQDVSSRFDTIFRLRFLSVLHNNAAVDMLKGKSPFHSMRKFYSQKLAESRPILHSEDIGLLMGHTPATMAYKRYIDANDEGMFTRVADVYSRTFFANWRVFA